MSQAYSNVSYSQTTVNNAVESDTINRSITNMVDNIVRSHKTICPTPVFNVLQSRGWAVSGGGPDIHFTKDGGYYMLTWGEALAVENMLMFMELEA